MLDSDENEGEIENKWVESVGSNFKQHDQQMPHREGDGYAKI